MTRPREWLSGVIVASPHSGRHYPDWFCAESCLDSHQLRSSEDAFVDRLIATASDAGAVTLAANLPRCLVDLNRGPDEFDPLAVTGAHARPGNPRITAGLGVIPRVVARGQVIRRHPIALAEARRRVRDYWHPYHAALTDLLAEAETRFGGAVLIDMHSMPADALAHLTGKPPQVVIGDRYGGSAGAGISRMIERSFQAEGFSVRRNAPFAGAYVTARYGAPTRRVHVVQVELNRALYMDEATIRPHAGFDDIAARLGRIWQVLAQLSPHAGDLSLAAE